MCATSVSSLHATATSEQMGTTALTAWLRRRIDEAELDTNDEDRSRRLESDAEAVQVLTIHRSKGLEFPVVYLPFLWEPGYIPGGAQPIFFHDPDAGDVRTIDVGLEGDDYDAIRSNRSSSSAARTSAWPTSRSLVRKIAPSSGGPAPGTAVTRRSDDSSSRATPRATWPRPVSRRPRTG